jgi:hypothetical protein
MSDLPLFVQLSQAEGAKRTKNQLFHEEQLRRGGVLGHYTEHGVRFGDIKGNCNATTRCRRIGPVNYNCSCGQGYFQVFMPEAYKNKEVQYYIEPLFIARYHARLPLIIYRSAKIYNFNPSCLFDPNPTPPPATRPAEIFYMTLFNHPFDDDDLFPKAIYLHMSQAKWRALMSPDNGEDWAFSSIFIQFQTLRNQADLYLYGPPVDSDEEQE